MVLDCGYLPRLGGALIIALSKALKGSSSTWLSHVAHPGMTWQDFKNLFLARYDTAETCAATIIQANNSRPKEGESLAAYASRLITSLMAKWKDMKSEEIAVSYVLAHLAQFDGRINRLAFTTDIKTRTKLIQEVQAFSLKRKQERNTDTFTLEAKRNRMNKPIQCYNCHKFGHRSVGCNTRNNKSHAPTSSSSTQDPKKFVTCYRCGEKGHIAPHCSKNGGNGVGGAASGAALERRVNFCEISGVRGELTQSGESYSFYFDSGAECSLVKASIANRFSGVRSLTNVRLTGVGNAHIHCTEQITCVVDIDGHSLHLQFLIVPDGSMPYDIMIGSDVLNLGVNVNLPSARLTITKPVSCCAITEIDFHSICTDISGALKDDLVNLLTEFSFAFIDGLPQ